jgi:mannose-6-phosphate isomerase
MMHNSTKIFRLAGKVQHYTWGGSQFIPALLHQPNNNNQPFAEYWMGAHDNVPSVVKKGPDEDEALNTFIKQDAPALLGAEVNNRFGRLPYLFKVLDVKDMLSIQVHPAKKAAEDEFAGENKKGTALNAPNRNYKDDNHKPELMLALGDFWLLHGFKPANLLEKVLQQQPELQFLLPVFNKGDYAALYKTVMSMDQALVNQHLQPLLDRIIPQYKNGQLNRSQEDFWAARAAITFNTPGIIDRGIFSVYLFNLVHLKEGEAIFQDAGIPHAYLEGQNMEIMANSDNVLRGGLTNKHVDVTELMKHVRFEPVVPQVVGGTKTPVKGEERFNTPVFDFELRRLTLKRGESTSLTAFTAEVFFVYSGKVKAREGKDELALAQGETMLGIAGASLAIEAVEDAIVFRATVPHAG